MKILDSVRVLIDAAGVFTAPLVLLAFTTFAMAVWAGLRVRDLEPDAPNPTRVIRDVTRVLRLLAAASSSAPLVGLLGTVNGLIVLFSGMQQAGVFDREVLTRGVGQALFTTEFGLAIAVPGIVLHAVIRRSLRARAGAVVRGVPVHGRRAFR